MVPPGGRVSMSTPILPGAPEYTVRNGGCRKLPVRWRKPAPGICGPYSLRGRHPRGTGQAAPTGHKRGPAFGGREPMLRLNHPLPDDYTLAAPAELEARIAAAKAELSDRL